MRTSSTLFTALFVPALFAQSPYRPFPESDAGWVESHSWLQPGGTDYVYNTCIRTVRFAADTLIAGTTYHQLSSRGECDWQTVGMPPFQYGTFTEPDAVFMRFRQDVDERRVYAYDTYLQMEVLWFDFTLGLGAYPYTYDHALVDDTTLQVMALDSMQLNDGWHRTWVLGLRYPGMVQDSAFCTVIEGVGSTYGLNTYTGFIPPFEWGDHLNCHSANDYTILPFGDSVCDLTTGVDDQHAPSDLHGFPNPASDEFLVRGSGPNGTHYTLTNAMGSITQTGPLRDGSIDVRHLAAGVYTVHVHDKAGTSHGTLRLIKQ